MALPNEIQVGRYNRFVQKLLSIKGKATTYLASPELDFMLPLFHGSENRYLEAWDLFGVFKSIPSPGVGNAATWVIRCVPGSNVVVVVTRAAASEATVGNQILTLFRPGSAGANAGDENTQVPAQAWDGRGRSSSSAIVSFNSAAQVVRTGGVAINVETNPVNTTTEQLRPGDEIPLTPGSVLTLSASNNNEAMLATYWWRERFLEDSERA